MQELARDAAAAGFSGLVITEAGRTAYLGCAAAALAADLDLLTGVAVAFPRSPMVTAQVAWELADASGGRFRLGLGTQVRAHIERRYSSAFDHPGPRLQEYVEAVRAAFAAFRGDAPLDHDGRFWKLSLLPPMWSPGPIGVADPPIDVAAVSPWMLRMAGEIADGVHVHPLNTMPYLHDTVLPNLAHGARSAGRNVADLEIIVPTFAPRIIGTACWTDSAPDPTTATIVEVVVEELCTSTVNRTPSASPANGLFTPPKSCASSPPPPSMPASVSALIALLIVSIATRKP